MSRAYIELIFATLFWGFGFISSIWVLGAMGPLWQVSLRFIISIVILDVICRLKLFGTSVHKFKWSEFLTVWKPGICLFGLFSFQTWGLKYTTATKSGFITVLYILFIPFLEQAIYKVRVKKIIYFWILIALTGTALICGLISSRVVANEFSTFNFGDFLTLICAFFAAFHVISVNDSIKVIDSSVKLHLYQCIWVAVFATVSACIFEDFAWIHNSWNLNVWIGLLELGVCSTAISFLIQIRVQRIMPPTMLGLILLLESPWAMLFSFTLGYENISLLQVIGGILILFAATGENIGQFLMAFKETKYQTQLQNKL